MAPFWQDAGVLATFLALLIALLQIWRTKKAANAAKEAAERAAAESRRSFQRYAALAARHLVDLVKAYERNKNWTMAAMRLDDLAKHAGDLAYIDSPDTDWIELAADSRSLSSSFGRKDEGTNMAKTQIQKWSDFLVQVDTKIDALVGGFQSAGSEN